MRFFLMLLFPVACFALMAGVGKADLTPPVGTPSAGYADRKGEGMEGVHDPLFAIALFLDTGEKKVVLCSVDHLGFTGEMVQKVIEGVHRQPGLQECEVYIASSHTHSGGGAHLNIPLIGDTLAGPYSAEITDFYIAGTQKAILAAARDPVPAKIGIGYGTADGLSYFRSSWPQEGRASDDLALIKVTHEDGTPLALLFNYATHPTVLKGANRQFSSDFVGYARDALERDLGVQGIYVNGAQGDIAPKILKDDRFEACQALGEALAAKLKVLWAETPTASSLCLKTYKLPYRFQPQATPFGLVLPIENYETEMNLLTFDRHAFLTIPGELSSLYDKQLKALANELGYANLSIFGLTNDAHGYILLPEAWRHRTDESALSFGGEEYGERVFRQAESLLRSQE
jgi:hypothetical protein